MKLFYREIGNGFPIIIIHGLYGSSDNWISIAKNLSDFFKIYLIDLRNHGNSPHSDVFSISAMSQDLKEFFENKKIKKAHLIGHSLGGKIAMHFAIYYPYLVKKLIVLDIAPKKYSDNNFAERKNHQFIINTLKKIDISKFNNRNEALAELDRIDYSGRLKYFMMKNIKRNKDKSLSWKINIKAIADNLSTILNEFDSDISAITCPTLFIKGEKSDYINSLDIEMLKNKLANVQFTTIKDATHWLHSEKPDKLSKIIINFLVT